MGRHIWPDPCLEPEMLARCRVCRAGQRCPAPVTLPWRKHSGVNAAFCTLFNGSGKTLHEVLAVADTISPPMAGQRVDQSLPRHGSVRPSLQQSEHLATCRSETGLRHAARRHLSILLILAIFSSTSLAALILANSLFRSGILATSSFSAWICSSPTYALIPLS